MRPLAAFARSAVLPGTFLLLSEAAALAAEAEQKGMPQLDFGNPMTTAQVVWLALIFAILYVLLSRWALPKVADVLEHRAASIGADLEAARTAKAEADAAIAELTAATRTANATAQAEVSAAIDAANKAALAKSMEADARLAEQLSGAEARIDAARKSAVGALREVATETAQMVVNRLTGTSFDTAKVAAAVDTAIAARSPA